MKQALFSFTLWCSEALISSRRMAKALSLTCKGTSCVFRDSGVTKIDLRQTDLGHAFVLLLRQSFTHLWVQSLSHAVPWQWLRSLFSVIESPADSWRICCKVGGGFVVIQCSCAQRQRNKSNWRNYNNWTEKQSPGCFQGCSGRDLNPWAVSEISQWEKVPQTPNVLRGITVLCYHCLIELRVTHLCWKLTVNHLD